MILGLIESGFWPTLCGGILIGLPFGVLIGFVAVGLATDFLKWWTKCDCDHCSKRS